MIRAAALALAALAPPPAPHAPLSAKAPALALRGVSFAIEVTAPADRPLSGPWRVTAGAREVARGALAAPVATGGAAKLAGVRLGAGDPTTLRVEIAGGAADLTVRAVPGWLSLAAPLVAIVLAIALRQVLAALLAGVWLGAWIADGQDPLSALLRTVDRYALGALAERDHAAIVLFTVLLGGMTGVIARAGGSRAIAEVVARLARDRRRGQVATWLVGLAIFFDDYASTLITGSTLRPVTDRLRISREKLAYVIDATAAPVASLALVSTWIGVEISYIGTELSALGIERNAYQTFLDTLPYRFYPILALVLGLALALSRRDFGPMLRAERRAAREGKPVRDGAAPASDFEDPALAAADAGRGRWWHAAAPIGVVIVAMLGGMYASGRAGTARGLLDARGPLDAVAVLREVLGAADPYGPLLWGSLLGALAALALAVGARALRLGDAIAALVAGCKAMVPAVAILVLAWSLGQACKDVHTADFLVDLLHADLDPRWLPPAVFLVSAAASFATGTSWGTMAILFPLVVPVAHRLAPGSEPILLGAISGILAGSVFGDHCSPISDTTILSSMAASCDHVDHVRTQLPYALVPAALGLLVGDVATSFGWYGPLPALLLGTAAIVLIVRFLGRPVDVEPGPRS